jgi:hypothetical protein
VPGNPASARTQWIVTEEGELHEPKSASFKVIRSATDILILANLLRACYDTLAEVAKKEQDKLHPGKAGKKKTVGT